MHPQQRFLHHVLGLGHAAEHPVRDRERDRPQPGKQLLAIGHAAASPSRELRAANPSRQLLYAGRHPSSRFALVLEAPRSSVIITTPTSPANSRPTTRGTRMGFLAPSS